jgi:hypothetical protein
MPVRIWSGIQKTSFFYVTYEWTHKARVFFFGKPFQPTVM